jgi:radical SAM superfamily enzyme YgiQ (UPF0313 family)
MMKNCNSILFIQLPLLHHSYDYIEGNIDYASASISGYIKKHICNNIEIYSLPFVLSNFASDTIITDYVCKLHPDMVAFTCYAWNVERSLFIAQNIKEHSADISIICGGPEIQRGSISIARHNEQIDIFVIGEGEWFFNLYLSGENFDRYIIIENNNKVVIQPLDQIIPAEMIFEPYTGNRLNTMPDRSMFFELTRGCPYCCMYCLYAKHSRKIREVPFAKLLEALKTNNMQRNLTELYILSPALEAAKNISRKLELLAEMNHGIRLHSEMRAENVSSEQARLLFRAGFRSLEIGLQTMNNASLKSVGRNSNPEKELDGILQLKKAGIDIKIGLIPGLPGDTTDSFISMIDRLIDYGLQENLELYPLMILPGTEIYDVAINKKTNFLRKPPYYYNSGWGMSFDDLRLINKYVEEKTGYSHITRRLPDFTLEDEGLYCRGIYINGNIDTNWNIKNYIQFIQTSVFSFFIQIENGEIVYSNLPHLVNNIPHNELFNIIIYNSTVLDEKRIISILEECEKDNLLRRIHIFHEWKDGLKIKIFQVMDTISCYKEARQVYGCIRPIFKVDKENSNDIDSLNDYEDSLLVSRGMFGRIKNSLKKFSDSPESIAFEHISEQKEFYLMIGMDYIQMPFQFTVMKL